MPTCRHCGATFAASRTGSTVHCPAHRTPASRKPTWHGVVRSTHESVSPVGRTCTVRYATTGACGKPAVHAFVSRGGEVFAECAEHRC